MSRGWQTNGITVERPKTDNEGAEFEKPSSEQTQRAPICSSAFSEEASIANFFGKRPRAEL